MPQFSGYMQVLPQTKEEEFEGMARALSLRDLLDGREMALWFSGAFYYREDTEEIREKLIDRAREITKQRKKAEKNRDILLDCIYGDLITNLGYTFIVKNTSDIIIEVDGEKYIISVESATGLENDNG